MTSSTKPKRNHLGKKFKRNTSFVFQPFLGQWQLFSTQKFCIWTNESQKIFFVKPSCTYLEISVLSKTAYNRIRTNTKEKSHFKFPACSCYKI